MANKDKDEMNNLPVGTVIRFKGQDLSIKKYFGSGFTSIVYSGILDSSHYQEKRPVAIKVIKQSAGMEVNAITKDEDDNLDSLMELESVQDEYTETKFKFAPIYYGSDTYKGNKYLVMELLEGTEIPKMLEGGKTFSEEQALKLAWQLFQFMEIIHTKLKKTIFDFKPENFWWTKENGGQLRVLDLGGLPPVQEDALYIGNPRLDILRGVAFLYQVMTGQPLHVPLSQVIEDVRPSLRTSSLSWGLRELLGHYLHPNPEFRCASAVEAKQAFFDLFGYWQKRDKELQSMAEANLTDPEASADWSTDESRSQARRARLLLGIIEKRNFQLDPLVQELINQANQVLEAGSYFRTGVNLFDSGAYAEACDQFKTALDFAEEKKKHRDWLLLSSFAKEIPSRSFTQQIREAAVKAVEQMVEGNYSEAYGRLQELEELPSKNIKALLTECGIFLTLATAWDYSSRNLFDDSIKEYEKILKAIKNLPPESGSLLNEIGDVRTLLETQKKLRDTLGQSAVLHDKVQLALQARNDKEAFTQLKESWFCYPKTDFHADFFVSTLKTFLAEKDITSADSLAELMRLMPAKPPAVQSAIDETSAWISAYHFFNQKDIDGFLWNIGQIHKYDSISPTPNNAFVSFIHTCVDELIQRKDGNWLSLIKPQVEEWFPASAHSWGMDTSISEFEHESVEKSKQAIDDIIRRKILVPMYIDNPANKTGNAIEVSPGTLLQFNTDQLENLKIAQSEIDDILTLAGSIHYKEEYLQQLKTRVASLITTIQGRQVSKQSKKTSSSEGLAVLKDELTICLEQKKELSTLEKSKYSPQSLQPLRMNLLNRIKDIYNRAYVLSIYDPNPQSEASKILLEAIALMEQYGGFGWQQIQAESRQHLVMFQEEMKKVKEAYSLGKIQEASAWVEIHRSACFLDPELSEFYTQVVTTSAFITWKDMNSATLQKCEYDQTVVSDAWRFTHKPIHQFYWNTPVLIEYFSKIQGALYKWLDENYTNRISPEYLRKVKQLIVVRRVFLFINNTGTSQR